MPKKMFRQGDVLIEQVDTIPRGAEELPREGGRVILAHGEVTGHAHAIADQNAVLMSIKDRPERYLDVKAYSTLSHEEHGPIGLPAGQYRITIQRQWEPDGFRNVVD